MICPSCHSVYPHDHTHCDLDGDLLIPNETLSGRFVVSLASEGASTDESSKETRIESPSGRQKLRQSDERSIDSIDTTAASANEVFKEPTFRDPATQVSGGPVSSRQQARNQAMTRCGQVLGSYRLRAVLGIGGMGAVYAAEHLRLGRQVALKLLHPEYTEHREAVTRFFQEAQAVNRIRHKNIVDVTDLVELDDGTSFIIMELLDGESLGTRLRRHGLLDVATTVSILIQICDGLDAAHSVDIVHRDLKPDNIFLATADSGELLVKLLDFGVAKLVGKNASVGLKTAAGSVVGTPAFMSPEQAGGLEVDHRSDIYSLGAIMYQLFTGQRVFRASSFKDFVNSHLRDEPVPPSQTPGGQTIAPKLEAMILRCLHKSPDARFRDAASLRFELIEFLEELTVDENVGIKRPVGPSASQSHYRSGQFFEKKPSRSDLSRYTSPPETIAVSSVGVDIDPIERDGSLLEKDGRSTETALMVGDLPGLTLFKNNRRPLWLALITTAILSAMIIAFVITRDTGDRSTANETVPPDEDHAVAVVPIGQETRTQPSAVDPPVSNSQPQVRSLVDWVTVQIRANTVAQVFAENSSTAVCGTPCQLRIDRNSERPRPLYVVRARGHRDREIRIDLTNPPTTIDIELTPIPVKIAVKRHDTTSVGPASEPKSTGAKNTGTKKTVTKRADRHQRPSAMDETGAIPAGQTLDPFGKTKK